MPKRKENSVLKPVDAATMQAHVGDVLACKLCPKMIGPVVTSRPVPARIYLIGQAPGPHEGRFGQPFAWTAGKTLFRWFQSIGVDEETFRANVFMAAVCRCFPGKAKGGGDRVPDPTEIANCARWMEREVALLKPALIIPVGRLGIERVLPPAPLAEIVGRKFETTLYGHTAEVIPLPHSSGASTWFKMEPGISLLQQALALLAKHPAWRELQTQAQRRSVSRGTTSQVS